MAARAPGVHTHEEWKGMAQPVGLVVEPVVLNRLGVFPESATTVLADWQQRLEQLLEDKRVGEQWFTAAPSFELFCEEVLAWQAGDLRKSDELTDSIAVSLEDYDEVLRPDWVVPEPSQEEQPLKAQLLVQELPLGTAFDALPKGLDGRRQWEATPQQRLERLLKESEHPIGLLWNGVALRLVFAPRGESSGHLTFPLEPMTTVDGRPMLAALQMLLGPDRLFEGGASNTRLRPLMEQSRKEQNEVSTRLAEQVLEALWILLRGFDAAGLAEAEEDPSHIYGGLITVLLRLVFLLYAEDEELMPGDSLYGQHYSVGGLAQRLRQDRANYQNAMEGRRGAWATLLSLFRLVYDGGGPSEAYLPARHGDLFDPDAYPFLEGRTAESTYSDGPLASVPAISDDVVEQVLTKLLLLDGQILSYRALDVEQIGSVYEGIMGFTVEQAEGPSVGITYRPPRQKITITVVVDAEQLLAQAASKREKWLDDQAGVKLKLPAAVRRELKGASTLTELCVALDKKLSPHTPRGLQAGSLILQPTPERRRSGSHYTPRALTEPIVAEAFRPWLERCNHQPTAEQILALKVCDPAMGSGAFLVATCRFLAGLLVQAWDNGDPYRAPTDSSQDKDTVARRLIAQNCLYGVDKNPFAVNLARLSLWLVTLSEHQPFTFVDHALKCGDSLVGFSVKEIKAAMSEVQLGLFNEQQQVIAQLADARSQNFSIDNSNDEAYNRKTVVLQQQIRATEGLRQAGDLMVAAFFDGKKTKDRAEKQQDYLAKIHGAFNDEGQQDSIQKIRERLATGDKGISPFHWDLEFPEAFNRAENGFDACIGNPPFLGSVGLSTSNENSYTYFLRQRNRSVTGKTDLCAYFLLQCWNLTKEYGSISLITSNTISQGDTRRSALTHIVNSNGFLYAATTRKSWPGIASVIISIVHIQRGQPKTQIYLNKREVDCINQFLIDSPIIREPQQLAEFRNVAFLGCKPGDKGFIVGEKKGNIPVTEAYKHFALYPKNRLALRPYMGGEELNNNAGRKPSRSIVYIDDAARPGIEHTLSLLSNYINPERIKRKDWHQFSAPARELMRKRKIDNKCILLAETSSAFMFELSDSDTVYSNTIWCFTDISPGMFALLQSLLHEEWTRLLSSTLKEDLRYVASACLETLPVKRPDLTPELINAEASYLKSRGNLLEATGSTLRGMHESFNSPSRSSDEALRCRSDWEEINNIILSRIGYSGAPKYGFGIDFVDFTDDAQVDDDIQRFIDRGDLFFLSPDEAINFESKTVAIGLRRKLQWRYRWPKALRDEVIDRLLALNAERYAEEVALGLHSKGAKKPTGKARGRKPKGSGAQQSDFQLEAEPYQAGLNLGL